MDNDGDGDGEGHGDGVCRRDGNTEMVMEMALIKEMIMGADLLYISHNV